MASIVDITDIVVAFGAKDELSTLSGPGSTIGSILFEVLWSDGYQEYIFADEEDINWVIRGDQRWCPGTWCSWVAQWSSALSGRVWLRHQLLL